MSMIGRLLKERGIKRRVIKVPRIKAKLNERRALQAIINEAVAAVFQHSEELIAAAVGHEVPRLLAVDTGEPIGVMVDAMSDIDRLIQLIVTQTQQVVARLELRLRAWGNEVNERHRRDFVQGVLIATTIDVSTLLNPALAEATVGEYVTWATSLIRDVSDEARRRISNAVIEAVRTRQTPRELAKVIQAASDMSYRRAKNIAADQSNKLNNALDRARQREAGIDHFTWRHSGKLHFRPRHKARNGMVYEWDTTAIQRGDFPGEPPFCGCVAQATIVQDAA